MWFIVGIDLCYDIFFFIFIIWYFWEVVDVMIFFMGWFGV